MRLDFVCSQYTNKHVNCRVYIRISLNFMKGYLTFSCKCADIIKYTNKKWPKKFCRIFFLWGLFSLPKAHMIEVTCLYADKASSCVFIEAHRTITWGRLHTAEAAQATINICFPRLVQLFILSGCNIAPYLKSEKVYETIYCFINQALRGTVQQQRTSKPEIIGRRPSCPISRRVSNCV